jgi:hypothetical protein
MSLLYIPRDEGLRMGVDAYVIGRGILLGLGIWILVVID